MKLQKLRIVAVTDGKTRSVSATIGPAKPKRFHPDPNAPSIAGRAVVSGPRAWALDAIKRVQRALKPFGYEVTTSSKNISGGVNTFKLVILKYPAGSRRRARR